MNHCKAKNSRGKDCSAAAGEDGFCYFHSPAQARKRARARKQGGERRRVQRVADVSGVPKEIRDVAGVMNLLDVAQIDTLVLDNSAQRTRALVGVASAYLKALEVGELEERIKRLEEIIAAEGHQK